MKSLLLAAALLPLTAAATNTPAPTTPSSHSTSASDSKSDSNSNSSSATNLYGSPSHYYAVGFPQPSFAAPLPANLCPKGDSLSWSIGWNFFSYSSTTTRTEMECLDKWVAAIRYTPPVLPPVANIHPTCSTPSTPTRSNIVKKPARNCK